MKKLIFTLLTCCILHFASNAQFCGVSDSLICSPDTSLKVPGFNPVTDSLAPFINGTNYSYTIHFKNFDTVPGVGVITTLKIDSIGNLPSGLCWATNKSNNTFTTSENGCIQLSGTVCDTPGQYLITIIADVNGFPLNLANAPTPVAYFIRVNNTGDTITPVDSVETPFVHYGAEVSTGCSPASVNEVEAVINSLSIVPNPVNTTAMATFVSTKSGKMTEKITNIIGEQVHLTTRQVVAGTNSFTIQRNNLPPGVYFYSLSDGSTMITKRMVVAE